MRSILVLGLTLSMALNSWGQSQCSCGAGDKNVPHPANRTMKPYAQEPEDLRPWAKFGTAYYEHYTNLVEYNGAAYDLPDPDLSTLNEIRIGFIGPLYDHPDQAFGERMLHGAQFAIDEANAAGGYCGKPFKLMLHNDSAIWGASSNEVVKMAYDDNDWAMFGSISGDTTHIALRVALKAEIPLVNSAATDPTIPETIIPWYFTVIQDDRVQSYTLARHIYTELGLKRVALLRVNERYGRFGVGKFRDASRRLGHPVVIEQKFRPSDKDFRRQLQVIADSRVDGIVLWTDEAQTAEILKEMKELGMKQRVFGSHRTLGENLLKAAGAAAEGFSAVYPYDPSRSEKPWLDFNTRFAAKYGEKPDHFAALAYDQMKILLSAICKAGLNRGRIRDALTATQTYDGVTGHMVFDPNCKNVSAMFLGTVRNGKIEYRRAPMEKAYAKVGEDGVQYAGPALPDQSSSDIRIALFGPNADTVARSAEVGEMLKQLSDRGEHVSLVSIPSDASWGKSSTGLVKAIYDDKVLGIVATDRNSAHLAEQLGTKAFVPVIALSDDHALTSINIPWIFRVSKDTPVTKAIEAFSEAIAKSGPNKEKIRNSLASGSTFAGLRFQTTGEPR